MAFHPFQFFRKRQKTFLAILTIFVMFIFILSYGKGDAFEWAMGLMGARDRADKTEATTLYGKTITVGDLGQLRYNRQAAENFVLGSIETAEPPTGGIEPTAKARIDQLSRSMAQTFGILRQIPPQSPFYQQFLTQAIQNYEALRREQQTLNGQGKAEAASYAAALARPVAVMFWRQTHPGQLYFGGTLAVDDLLDFLLWRQQADKLKITLTDEDVRREVNSEVGSEALTGNEPKDAEKLRNLLRGAVRNYTPKELYAALRDEFRVRLAQEALLGTSPGARLALGTPLASTDLPNGATPEQFWEFYKDKQTKLDVGFIKVPVKQFIDQVKEEPTDKELRDLFEKYKNAEPGPEREQPGFKVPRRVKVEWVSANPDGPFYQKKAGEVLRDLEFARPFLAAVGPGDNVLSATARLAAALTPDLAVRIQYESFVKGTKSWWDASILPAMPSTGEAEREGPYALGLHRPDTVAAVLGQLSGAAATGAALWTTPATLAGATELRLAEQRARAAGIALAGSNPFLPGVIAQEAASVTVPVPPLTAVHEDMAERARARLGPQLADGALETFTKELKPKRFKKEEAAEYIEKNANPEHGITAHAIMAEPKDATEIATDPALAPLRAAQEGQVGLTPQQVKDFADRLLRPTQTYDPEPYHNNVSGTPYYFWLTENPKAKQVSFDEARPKVLAGWKFARARELARKAAEQVIADLKARPQGTDAERFLRDDAARHGYEWFSAFPPITKLDKVQTAQVTSADYRPYKFKETDFPYPRPDAVDKLFQDLKQPDDATVLKDRPDRVYYVAVLLKRPDVPTERQFFDVYKNAPRGFLTDPLWASFQNERDDQYREALVKQFRTESQAPLGSDGNYKLDPDVRKRLTVARSDAEE
jgi:hypothetical protein